MIKKQIKNIILIAIFALCGTVNVIQAQSKVKAEYASGQTDETRMVALYNLAADSGCSAPFEYKGTIVMTKYDDDFGTRIIGFTISDRNNRRTYFNIDEELYAESKIPRFDMDWIDTLITEKRQVGVLAYGCGATGRVLMAHNVVDLAFIKSPTLKNIDLPKQSQISETDHGVDLARVIVKKANLRMAAGINNDILKEISQGDLLVLLDKEPTGVWYNVIDYNFGEEGRIHGNNIEIQYTNQRRKSQLDLVQKTANQSDINPYIIISNDSRYVLYLKFGANRYVIRPSNNIRVDLSSGTYDFYASSPKVLPDIGLVTLKQGTHYTLSFYTQTVLK